MIIDYFIPSNIINLKKIIILIDENFYDKFTFKVVKFYNFENPSPNFSVPSEPILLFLLKFYSLNIN